MTWAARVRDAFSGDESQRRRFHTVLLDLYRGVAARRAQLLAHADAAPTEAGTRALQGLAADLGATADALRGELDARGVTLRSAAAAGGIASGKNHWARLVADLEAQQAARHEILVAISRFADSDPEAGALLDKLLAAVEGHCLVLRGEIARADPQALD